MTPLIDQDLSCEACGSPMTYLGDGEWQCSKCAYAFMAEYLDGEGFVDWLGQHIDLIGIEADNPDLARRIRDWVRAARPVSIYTVDRYLIRFGLHISMLLDELWVATPGRVRVPAQIREAITARALGGETYHVLAKENNISPDTIGKWVAATKRPEMAAA